MKWISPSGIGGTNNKLQNATCEKEWKGLITKTSFQTGDLLERQGVHVREGGAGLVTKTDFETGFLLERPGAITQGELKSFYVTSIFYAVYSL